MSFRNRIRLPFFLSKPQFPVESSKFTKADGSTKVLTVTIKNTYEGKTDLIPEDWHRKLVIALNHDEVTIEDDRFLSDVVLESEYGIDWQDFLNYPIAQSKFTIQVTPFNATNSNCQTCDEIAQLDLVDDTTADVFEEGSTNVFPFLILTNDEICCYPFEVEIVSFNTLYFSSVTVDQAGQVTFTVLPSVPTIPNVLLATYRVTCPNGAYDEANIYVGIEGTSVECVAPQNLTPEVNPTNGDVTVIFDPVLPTPAGYNWWLYLASDIYTPVQSGTTTDYFVNLTGLTPGENYVFAVQTDCGGDTSTISTVEFTSIEIEEGLCGSFMVTYQPTVTDDFARASYMDCNGQVQNLTLVSAYQNVLCMLINEGETTPVFFGADRLEVTVEYLGLC